MSKLTSFFNQPKMSRDNYSMDIKELRRNSTYLSPFAKKRMDSSNIKRNKTPSNLITAQNSKK